MLVLLVVIFHQSSLMAASPPGPVCVPPIDCPECSAGIVPRDVKSGCPGCPECCVPLPCAPIACPTGYISQPNLQSNGCPGCNTCVECPIPDCQPTRCAPGHISKQTIEPNGCPGCNKCVRRCHCPA